VDASKRSEHPRAGRVKRSRAGGRKAVPKRAASAMDRLAARVAAMTDEQRDRLAAYLDKGLPLSEQVRLAIDASGESRYAICKSTGIPQGQMSRFMGGTIGLSLDALDVLCAYLGLELKATGRKA
jgi:hypothetical protein